MGLEIEIMFALFIVAGVLVAISLIVFLFFIEVALIPQMYKKMIPYWFIAGISSLLHLASHIGGEIVYGSRLVYMLLNSLAATALLATLLFMTRDVFRAVVLVESGKKLEEEVEVKTRDVKSARDHLQAIMDSSPDLIFTVKKDGTFGYANKKLKDILGYELEEIIGRHFMDFIPKEMHSFMQKKWEELQKGIAGAYETKVAKKDGSVIDCSVTHSALGDYSEFLVFLTDITEIKKAENELKRRMQELELFHRVGKERELRMVELKSKIANLERRIKELEEKKAQ